MKAHSKDERVVDLSNEQVTEEIKVPYKAPEVIVMGRVEQLTALLRRGPRDLLSRGNLL